ncbi:MAG: hypothetical protein IJO81_01755 [Clostridia bacterium]|nr:hypothetical protein [Clostridia bacterium]
MIKIERTSAMNFDNAIRGARNPMNSWAKSDSYYDDAGRFVMGEADLAFGKRLVTAGPDHRKFIRQIFVSVDITAPLYWWKEFDTYKVGTVANSTSTMHKIHSKSFERDDFSHDKMSEGALACLDSLIAYLEDARVRFIETKDKAHWHDMIQLLPSSYNQMRTVTLNYENLINIYNARCTHKLDEWHRLCEWILTLPYADDLLVPALRQTNK